MQSCLRRHVWQLVPFCVAATACAKSAADRVDSIVRRPVDTTPLTTATVAGRYELRTLQDAPLPVTIAQIRTETRESCGDTTYAASYDVEASRWIQREVTGSDCEQPSEHRESIDSGVIERRADTVRFVYSRGGAITGRVSGDSLIIEDGGPREVYLRGGHR